jgi:AraC-like DNA-binding protein
MTSHATCPDCPPPKKKPTAKKAPSKRPGVFMTGLEMAQMHADGKTVSEIASRNHVTLRWVHHLVQQATGMSPTQYRLANGWLDSRVLSPHVVLRVRAAYRADPKATNGALAERTGISPTGVARVLAVTPLVEPRLGHEPPMDLGVTAEELIRLYVEDELSTVELGERFNADPSTIARHLKRAGIKLRRKGGALAFPLEEAVRLYREEEYTPTMLARRFGVSAGAIVWQLDKVGAYQPRSRRLPSDEALLREYEASRVTQKDLAKRYTVSAATITRHLNAAKRDRADAATSTRASA